WAATCARPSKRRPTTSPTTTREAWNDAGVPRRRDAARALPALRAAVRGRRLLPARAAQPPALVRGPLPAPDGRDLLLRAPQRAPRRDGAHPAPDPDGPLRQPPAPRPHAHGHRRGRGPPGRGPHPDAPHPDGGRYPAGGRHAPARRRGERRGGRVNSSLPTWLYLAPFLGALLCAATGWWIRGAARAIALAALAAMTCLALAGAGSVLESGRLHSYLGGWAPPIGIELALDPLSALMVALVSATAFAVLLGSGASVRAELEGRETAFHALALLMVAGMTGIAVTADLFNLFV